MTYREVTLSHEGVLAHLEGQIRHESRAHRCIASEELQVCPSSHRQYKHLRRDQKTIATLTQIPSRQLQVRRVRNVHYTASPRQLLVLPPTN